MIVGALFMVTLMINIARGHKNRREEPGTRWEEEDLDLLEEEFDEISSSDDVAYSSNIITEQNNKTANAVTETKDISSTKKMNPIRPEIRRYQPSTSTTSSRSTSSTHTFQSTPMSTTSTPGSISASVSKSSTSSNTSTSTSASVKAPKKSDVSKKSAIFVLNVLASQGKAFVGYELLQSLLAAGLHFGEMNIFHRYKEEGANSNTKPIFSLASAVEPGTFDINRMGGFSSPGLTLFMQVTPDISNPQPLFETMLDTAKQLADDLGGEVYDDKRQPWSDEALHRYLQRIQ
jgi:cell division protein ZipA